MYNFLGAFRMVLN